MHLKCVFDGYASTAIHCEGDNYLRVLTNHSHEPDRDEVDMLLFRSALREEAASTSLDMWVIYQTLSPRYA